MEQIISPVVNPIDATISIPGSKSMTNRALLLAALAEGVSEIHGLLLSDDTHAFINALKALGIVIQVDPVEKFCIVAGCQGKFPKAKASIWCDSAGTVARFMLAACASCSGEFYFDGTPQLRRRPLVPLMKVLMAQGIEFIPEDTQGMPFTMAVKEPLKGDVVNVEGQQTGQFISALLMVAPFAQTSVEIQTETIVSRSYVDMTCAMMAEFGVQVQRLHQTRFLIPVPQKYKALNYVIEPDLSTASYFFAAAAITRGRVSIQTFDREQSKQGDVKFIFILEKMGCEVIESPFQFTVRGPKELKGIDVDMSDFSDTFMTVAAMAPFATTPTTITHIGHTRLQESNRITAMCEGLRRLKVKVEEGEDWIRIYPSDPQGTMINSHQDHRIAMAFSVVGLRVPGIRIEGAGCVSKTCPEFFKLWKKLSLSS